MPPNRSLPSAGLGTFMGVYLPCTLTILGVILFLRLGWVVGNLGLAETLILVTLANSITFVTGLSIASIATNMQVRGGGSYYMISRSLGIEPGAAVGLPLFFAQALGIAFYTVGFAEALSTWLPEWSIPQLGSLTLLVLLAIALVSAEVATKTQLAVFTMILISLLAIVLGGPPEGGFAAVDAPPPVTFWVAFAVFFPAVTGIEAGVALSGDLKDSRASLPKGTLLAILTGYAVYMLVPVLLVIWVPLEVLRADPLVLNQLVPAAWLIGLGLWGAALSSALNSLLAAPRTLQALARDRVAFGFLGKGTEKDDTPRRATLLSFALALIGIWAGDLNQIAEILSMFFLTTYGLLNFAAGAEALMDNPSWRPSFKVKWWISMSGAVACFGVMFLLNPWATFAALAIGQGILIWMYKRRLNRRWDDIRLGFFQFLARAVLYRIRDAKPDIRSWRPNLLVFAGAINKRWYLVKLGEALAARRGLMTVAAILPEGQDAPDRRRALRASLKSYLDRREVPALVEVQSSGHPIKGARHLTRYYGMGLLKPNTLLLGQSREEENRLEFGKLVLEVFGEKKNLILAEEEVVDEEDRVYQNRIDLWWGGKRRNEGFMLAIAYMMQQSDTWKDFQIRLLTIVDSEEEAEATEARLVQLLADARVNGEPKALVRQPGEQSFDLILRNSRFSKATFLGLRPPEPDEEAEEYSQYLFGLQRKLPPSPMTCLVLVAQDLPFIELFE
ncbi:MAG: Na-K-Cl cotransporter [bacterium]|nr:Na-K-Cl cotransporter [bacterium]